jgi:hypothetical protein
MRHPRPIFFLAPQPPPPPRHPAPPPAPADPPAAPARRPCHHRPGPRRHTPAQPWPNRRPPPPGRNLRRAGLPPVVLPLCPAASSSPRQPPNPNLTGVSPELEKKVEKVEMG